MQLDASRVPTPQLVQYFVGVLLLLAIRNQRGSLEDRWKQVPRQGRYNGNPIQIQLLLLFLLRSRKVATWQSLEDRTHEANDGGKCAEACGPGLEVMNRTNGHMNG
jgi:hypothetical protein